MAITNSEIDVNRIPSNISKIGFYTALLTTVITVATFIVAYFTPPLSGPFCQNQPCYSYPYLDVVSRFPRDYLWMYPAIVLLIVYMMLMTAVYYGSPENKKIYSHIGLFFAVSAAMILIADYFIQLSVVQPSLLKNETDGISLLSQYNPHGIFIVLEDLGYFIMAIAFLFMAPVFHGTKLKNVIRWVFIASFLLTVFAFVYFTVTHGINREYRFEIAAISINWFTLIVSGILLSIYFNKSKTSL